MVLSKEFLGRQQKALLEEKNRVEKKIKQLKEFPDYGSGEENNVEELTDFENNQPLGGQLKVVLAKINKALTAIDKGTYGLCIRCRNAIEQGRLKAMPYADICVSCAPQCKR